MIVVDYLDDGIETRVVLDSQYTMLLRDCVKYGGWTIRWEPDRERFTKLQKWGFVTTDEEGFVPTPLGVKIIVYLKLTGDPIVDSVVTHITA